MIEIDIENILDPSRSLLQSEQPFEEEFSESEDDGTDDEIDEGNNDDERDRVKQKKRKRNTIVWTFQKHLENNLFVEAEILPKWSNYRKHDTIAGHKIYYKCNHPKCPARIHLLYLKNQTRISLFSNQEDHLHLPLNKQRGIDEKIKQMIKDIYSYGVTGAMNIIYALRDKKVEKEKIPSKRQLYNFLYHYKQELYGSANKYFRLVMTTNSLIENIEKRDILVVDSTYKIIFQGFPLMITGTVDYERHFQPICAAVCSRETADDFEFVFRALEKKYPNKKWNYLLADAAGAITNGFERVYGTNYKRIMCWAHANRAMDNNLKVEKETKAKILNDINSLHLSFSESKFQLGYKLLKEKWEINEPETGTVEFFEKYFENERINSKNYGWFEGIAYSYPSTNNATLKKILSRWSNDGETIRIFEFEPKLVDQHWYDLIDYLESKPVVKFIDYEDAYFLSHDSSADFYRYLDLLDCNGECYPDCETKKPFSISKLIIANSNQLTLERIQRKAIRYSFNMPIDTKVNELYNLCSLEPVLERSLKLTDKYLCEAAKSNELIQRELNIYRQAPELDEGGLCKGIARKTVFGFIQSMECRKFFQQLMKVSASETSRLTSQSSQHGIYYKPPKNTAPLPPGAPVVWMQKPKKIPGCPTGLEYLTQVDALIIHQKVSFLEAVVGWDTNNKYFINNNTGNQVFFAAEESETCMRICCGYQRGFTFHIVDNLYQEVIRVKREFKCAAGCCCWCPGSCEGCAQEVTVEAPIGTIVGYVKQIGSMWRTKYDVLNDKREPILRIHGPCCVCDGPLCPCNNEFQILTCDCLAQIGSIKKDYAGFVREMLTVSDSFSIKFPMDLSVKAKSLLLGAFFLIDFMHFDKSGDDF
ncbi:unnamed protein product [Brachionus calyciflorus]|uniref:MULE transposase domain-containing protein n=1 Tax=Brachionus calyciflorus TaxID=104777 RepID=A0A813NS36_9BILA|nr:unnamed protein product [Brachionus calyciflorus]